MLDHRDTNSAQESAHSGYCRKVRNPTVLANLVLSRDHKGVRGSTSKSLTFPEDRARFHEIRSRADLIIIGGNSARHEPYQSTPIPLLILSRSPQEFESGLLKINPLAQVDTCDLASAIKKYSTTYPAILIEGGPALIEIGLRKKLIDTFYLTITDVDGDVAAPALDISDLLSEYRLVDEVHHTKGEFFTYTL